MVFFQSKRKIIIKYLVIAILAIFISSLLIETKTMTEPKALKKDFTHEIHGDKRLDPYYWLNDRDDPEVISYLKSENNYCENGMKVVKELENELYSEMTDRLNPDESSVPVQVDNYWYQTRFESGNDYPLYCRRKGSLDSAENIVLDVNLCFLTISMNATKLLFPILLPFSSYAFLNILYNTSY